MVEIMSEDKDFPIESSLFPEQTRGWRAAEPGAQQCDSSLMSPKSSNLSRWFSKKRKPHPFRIDSNRLPTPELRALILGHSPETAVNGATGDCERIRVLTGKGVLFRLFRADICPSSMDAIAVEVAWPGAYHRGCRR